MIACGGLVIGGHGTNELALNLQGAKPNVFLQISDISAAVAQNVPDLLTDLLDVAVYVFAADQGSTRGGARDSGEKWRRDFRFHIPVRSPDTWKSDAVSNALADALSFVSDDTFEFVFTKLDRPPPIQLYFDHLQPDFQVEEVMLFSGGLDSLAGAIHEVLAEQHSVALVSHDSASKRKPVLSALANELSQIASPRVVRHIPVWAAKSDEVGAEYTQRTRSFLYASLAACVARLLGRDRIRFYENGVTSMNLPIAPQVVGSRATRTTHPQTIRAFGRFFSALFDRTFRVESPFVWKTKTDIVRVIKDSGHGDLVAKTVSCSRTFEATKLHTHCGRCSQCIDRRFATLASGATDAEDPPEMYKVDLLTGDRPFGESRSMAESFLQRATKLKAANDLSFFAEYPEATRAIRHVDLPSDEAAKRIVELHRRHAEDVSAALANGLAIHARALQEAALPDTCLLVLNLPQRYRQSPSEKNPGVPTFRRDGDVWRTWFEHESTTLKDSVGLRHIARLLASPGRDWGCLELLAAEAGHTGPVPVASGGGRSDRSALRAYKARLEQISDEIVTAKTEGDPERVIDLQREADALNKQLRADTRLGGAPRPLTDDAEKARKAVSIAVRRSLKSIQKKHPGLERHLHEFLNLGTFASYSPDPEVLWVTS